MDVAIDDPGLLQNLAGELNYRLALTLNALTLLTSDSAVAVDSTVNIVLPNGAYMTANNIRSAVQSLAAANVRPWKDNRFGGLMHPYIVKDVLNDTSTNGLTDILKRGNESDRSKLMTVPTNDEVIEFAGATFKQTTTVNTPTIGGNTYYNTYLYGDDALFSVFLGPTPEGGKNYKLNVQMAPESGSVSDPGRLIGGWVSYNVRFTNTLPPGAVQRLRRLQSESSSS